jgi:hypothetical protein
VVEIDTLLDQSELPDLHEGANEEAAPAESTSDGVSAD